MTARAGSRVQVGAGIVCFRGDSVLLIRRGKAPAHGTWSIPGGRIERGETAADAALRELQEETGITARLIGLVDVVDAIFDDDKTGGPPAHYLLFDFAAVWSSGEPVAADDATDAQWVSPEALDRLPLWDETRRIIADARQIMERFLSA